MEVSLIFPNHIYEFNPCITTKRKIIILEDHLYFTEMRFHKQKLVLHRATMRFYQEYLTKYGFDVEYIECGQFKDLEDIFKKLTSRGVKKIHHVETVDYRMEIMITKYCREFGITRKLYDTPNFITKHDDIPSFFDGKKYSLADFYIKQRKKTGILVENGTSIPRIEKKCPRIP